MKILIRAINESDYILVNKIRRMKGVLEYILSLKSETIQETKNWIDEMPYYKHTFVAAIIEDSKELVVGYIRLSIDDEIRKRHKGKISIAVDTNFQGMGIGSLLMDEMLDFAEKWLMLKKLELTVLIKNEKAINLYIKKGFEKEGLLKKDCVVDGIYEDVYLMAKHFL